MSMKKKIIAAAAAAAMFAPCIGQAAEWIQLSAWSYAEVSSFISDGLLPESMKGISDYKRTINRGEFCELVYSALRKSGMLFKEEEYEELIPDAGEYAAANRLLIARCMPQGCMEQETIHPDKALTRLWAAELSAEVLTLCGKFAYSVPKKELAALQDTIKDADKIPDDIFTRFLIYQLISSGVMSLDDDGCFNPDEEMTIEQAVVMVERMYRQFPRIITADIESGESSRNIGGGLTEEINSGFYEVKNGDLSLLKLETDVYTTLTACSRGGRQLVFAVNFNDKTDVFDAESGELIFTIPAIVKEVDGEKGFIYTVSSEFIPYYSGLWSMDFKELLPPEYSRGEIAALIKNDFKASDDTYRPSDGWVYYSDRTDNGHIYRIDSNGENKSCLVNNKDCSGLSVDGDWLYFLAKPDNQLYRVKLDSSEEQKISDSDSSANLRMAAYPCLCFDVTEYDDFDKEIIAEGNICGFEHLLQLDSYTQMSFGKDVLYKEITPEVIDVKSDFGDFKQDGEKLYKVTPDGKHKDIADFYVAGITAASADSGRIFFANQERIYEKSASPIYMYDGKETKCISGSYEAVCFGFMCDRESRAADPDNIGFITIDDLKNDSYHVLNITGGEVSVHKLEKREEQIYETPEPMLLYECEKAKVYRTYSPNAIKLEYSGKTESLNIAEIIKYTSDGMYYYDSQGSSNGFMTNASMRRLNRYFDLMYIDFATGAKTPVLEQPMYLWNEPQSVVCTPLGELCRIEDGKGTVIYPAKGIRRYGEAAYIGKMPEFIGSRNCIYKLDTDGNIVPLTDTDCEDVIYVPDNLN